MVDSSMRLRCLGVLSWSVDCIAVAIDPLPAGWFQALDQHLTLDGRTRIRHGGFTRIRRVGNNSSDAEQLSARKSFDTSSIQSIDNGLRGHGLDTD